MCPTAPGAQVNEVGEAEIRPPSVSTNDAKGDSPTVSPRSFQLQRGGGQLGNQRSQPARTPKCSAWRSKQCPQLRELYLMDASETMASVRLRRPRRWLCGSSTPVHQKWSPAAPHAAPQLTGLDLVLEIQETFKEGGIRAFSLAKGMASVHTCLNSWWSSGRYL